MKAWLIAHVQAFERATKRLAYQPIGNLFSIVVIGFALTFPLGLYILFSNLSFAASRIDADPNVSLYLALSATEADARALELRIKSMPHVSSVRFVSRESAIAELKRVANLADLLSGLESNPLPHAMILRPATIDPGSLAALRQNLVALPKVDQVVMDFEWAQKLKRFATFAERLVVLLWVVLSAAVVFVTGNTIRLQILTQRDEIELSQLIGATYQFICRPFLYFGVIQGVLAGAIAVTIVFILTSWAGDELQALISSYGSDFQFRAPSASLSGTVVLLSALLGWIGAYTSVWLYWRADQAASNRR